MGNKIEKLSRTGRSTEEERQPLLKSESEEGSSKEKKEDPDAKSKGNKYERLYSLEHSEEEEHEPILKFYSQEPSDKDFPIDSRDDSNSIAEYLEELSDSKESSVEYQEAEASGPPENIKSEDLAQSSNAMKDLFENILAAMSNSGENIPLENLKKKLSKEDIYLLDLLMKVSKELKNILVANSAWKNLMELLVTEELNSDNPEASSGFQSITTESLFSLSVYGINCHLSSGPRNLNRTENPAFYNYILPLLQEKGLSCLNITRYNSDRKRIMDITLICREISCTQTKFVLYLWDSKDDKWRLVDTPFIEMGPNKCFSPPDYSVRAKKIPNQRDPICKCKDLSQPTPSADLPFYIRYSLESETRLTAFNSYLEKKIDVTLAQGKKHEHKTDFYIEWTGDKKVAYSFTIPNDAEPAGQ